MVWYYGMALCMAQCGSYIINGVSIYAKGADWVPPDSLQSRITPDLVCAELRAARDAHMNMLRIWGGGV
jgi:beta-mannosidase